MVPVWWRYYGLARKLRKLSKTNLPDTEGVGWFPAQPSASLGPFHLLSCHPLLPPTALHTPEEKVLSVWVGPGNANPTTNLAGKCVTRVGTSTSRRQLRSGHDPLPIYLNLFLTSDIMFLGPCVVKIHWVHQRFKCIYEENFGGI